MYGGAMNTYGGPANTYGGGASAAANTYGDANNTYGDPRAAPGVVNITVRLDEVDKSGSTNLEGTALAVSLSWSQSAFHDAVRSLLGITPKAKVPPGCVV